MGEVGRVHGNFFSEYLCIFQHRRWYKNFKKNRKTRENLRYSRNLHTKVHFNKNILKIRDGVNGRINYKINSIDILHWEIGPAYVSSQT